LALSFELDSSVHIFYAFATMVGFAFTPCFAALFASALMQADADSFLHKLDVDMESLSLQVVEQSLMTQLALVGRDQQLQELQDELRPMYEALPKNAMGRLSAPVVRLALHRFFSQARGWFLQGLQPTSEWRNASASVQIMKELAPSFIEELLEQRANGQGLELQDLAAFAATLQDLVHAESMQTLRDVFEVSLLPKDRELTDQHVEELLDLYLMQYVAGGPISHRRQADIRRNILRVYPGWPAVAMWARDLRQTMRHRWQSIDNPFAPSSSGFHEVSELVREAGYRFGTFQDEECRTMKDRLTDMEYRDTGRVRLSDFYKPSLEGDLQFLESMDYLRDIGALDESNPRMPSVLIANYVGAQSNCLASSSFYSVCCLDECEGLLGKLEAAIGAPTAEAGQISTLLAAMPSDTVDAPRNLSTALLVRLDEIASHHGGRVPLHGRLFAQLMHHAYPRECPFPHVAGTTNPMLHAAWQEQNGYSSARVTKKEARRHVSAGQNVTHQPADELEELPWTSIEELVAVHEPTLEFAGNGGSWLGFLSKVVLLLVSASLVAPSVVSGVGKLGYLVESEPELPKVLV
jgi:hypothetical protein